jgi:DNA repair protein RadC
MSASDRLTMKNLPADDQPCEKLLQQGARALSDAELLAVVIRSGSRSETALALCQRLLAQDEADSGLAGLQSFSLEELMGYPGIGKVKACQMKAALEIGARAATGGKSRSRPLVRTQADALALIETDMRNLPREELRMILLDTRSRLIRTCRVAEGGLSMSVIHPRDLFREVVRANAAALILAHNHPSGDASPSQEDLETTRRLIDAGEMMGVKVIDHLIVATGGSISLRQHGFV